MCGRYNIIDDPFLRDLMQLLGIDAALPTRVNIAPTETVPLVVQRGAEPELRQMRWWLTPSWSGGPSTRYSMFNARSETVSRSRAFRGAFRRQRGLAPASSFIEWQTGSDGNKQPWLVRPVRGIFAFAAIWDRWEREGVVLESCALLTMPAVPAFAELHRRMPVMLRPEDYRGWLDPQCTDVDRGHFFRQQLPCDICIAPLDRAINNARHKDPAALAPVGEARILGA